MAKFRSVLVLSRGFGPERTGEWGLVWGSGSYAPRKFFKKINHEIAYFLHFYRAMQFSAKRGIAIACRLSVCPSFFVLTQYRLVTDRQTDRRRDKLQSLLPALAYRRAGNKKAVLSQRWPHDGRYISGLTTQLCSTCSVLSSSPVWHLTDCPLKPNTHRRRNSTVIGDESEGGDCDELICAGWGEPGQW